ncbi:glypican-5-like [Lingula anatina]|uniref:Glypican-5-like n=1 Tax=Lingula anatina TaxID=7574 RepID=A0A1S3JSX1_LINAN|nr:glypican-5-like [Lingula anatina]|eukprot:XP_013413470.1 glypican-5-like [Lingula anatina]
MMAIFRHIHGVLVLFLLCQTSGEKDSLKTADSGSVVASPKSTANSMSPSSACHKVREEFGKTFPGHASLVPAKVSHDDDMEICYRGRQHKGQESCCNRAMERKYLKAAEKDLEEVVKITNSYLKNLVTSSAKQFQDLFLSMIERAENSTDLLFSNIYKLPQQERQQPIRTFFTDLKNFIRRKQINIHTSVEQFFIDLFPLVFHNNLNDPNKMAYTEEYKRCLVSAKPHVHPPFGEWPRRIALQLAQVFGSTRTFLEAVNLAVETVNTTEHLVMENHCHKAVTKLRYCSQCRGHTEAKPCYNYCLNVMRGCLAEVQELSTPWNSFVDSVEKYSQTLTGSYSIETVMQGLDNKISDALMYSMTNGLKFYSQVIAKCGHPKMDTKKLPGGQKDEGSEVTHHKTMAAKVKYTDRLWQFTHDLKASKGFYTHFADAVCENENFVVRDKSSLHCWNGEHMGRYTSNVTEVGLIAQVRFNPEMTVVQGRTTTVITLKDKLMHMAKQLESSAQKESRMQADQWVVAIHNHYPDNFPGSGDGALNDDEDFGQGSGSGFGGDNDNDGQSSNPEWDFGDGSSDNSQHDSINKNNKPNPGAAETKGPTGESFALRVTLTSIIATTFAAVLWVNG